MTFAAPSLALMLLALLGFLALERARRRGALAPRRCDALLAVLVGVAFLAHLGLLRGGEDGALELRAPSAHSHELFHYFLGTKYFGELGYEGLYAAAVIADLEDTPEYFRPELVMRDLTSNRIIARGDMVPQAPRIRGAFTPERWERFKADVGVFREAMPDWRAHGPVIDHGYNGTPLVTAVLGGLAAQPFLDTRTYLDLVSLLDPYWLALAAVAIAGLQGAVVGLVFLFFAFANPLNEYGFTGGSYLRYDYLLALAAGLVALRQGWRASAGGLLAVAAGLRLFPIALYACLALRDVAGPGWRERLRANARLHVGFAVGALAIFAATSLLPTPDGGNPWLACARNIRKHTSAPAVNQVALATLFAYAPSKDRLVYAHQLAEKPPDEPPFDWIVETERLLAERRWYHAAAALALLGAALASLRRLGDTETLFPALLVVFAILPVSHYYWALLALAPLAAPRSSRVEVALALACCAFALIAWPGWLEGRIDLHFALFSLVLLAFLLAALALCRKGPRRGGVSGVALLACAGLVLSGCGRKTGEGSLAHLPIDGNRYESRTFGFAIDKPDAWSFLPESSLAKDGDERASDRWQRWEHLKKPALTPLISMAPSPAPRMGVDPILRVFVIPISPSEGPRGLDLLTQTKPDEVVTTFSHNRSRHPGYERIEDARPVKVGGLDGAGVRLRYQLAGADGALAPVEERLWHVRRGEEYWYFSQLGPDPLPEPMAAQLEQILASARLDP